MYTPQEIRSIEFTKTLGGYKTTEVDDFIDGCADTVEALLKEKNELAKKLARFRMAWIRILNVLARSVQ